MMEQRSLQELKIKIRKKLRPLASDLSQIELTKRVYDISNGQVMKRPIETAECPKIKKQRRKKQASESY